MVTVTGWGVDPTHMIFLTKRNIPNVALKLHSRRYLRFNMATCSTAMWFSQHVHTWTSKKSAWLFGPADFLKLAKVQMQKVGLPYINRLKFDHTIRSYIGATQIP